MCVMYGTKVYDISIDHCLYWGMQHGYVHGYSHMYILGLLLYHRPPVENGSPFGISKFFDVCSPL